MTIATTGNGDLETIVDTDLRFYQLIIKRCGWPHCEQIWRTIVPRVRAYFYADAPQHASLAVIAAEHQALLELLRGADETDVLAEVEWHVRRRPGFGGFGQGNHDR